MLLIGDIGGTKTDLAIVSDTGEVEPEFQSTFKSADHPSLESIIQIFLANTQVTITKAVFGVAGPVVDGEAQITNLPWRISEKKLRETFKFDQARLLNDLEAIAYAVPNLPARDLAALNGDISNRPTDKNKAVIAPGTGLGEAILFYHANAYHVMPSEGGHASFAPNSLFEIGLLRSLLEKYSHVSYERVCSGGLGIPNIYSYLKENKYAEEAEHIKKAIEQAADPTPIIVQAGLKHESEMCIQTLNAFVSILGAEASNLALKVMALGGVYLGGGIPPKILPKLKDGTFMAAFVRKGRFSDMLAQIPVYVILNQKPALLGAAHYARDL